MTAVGNGGNEPGIYWIKEHFRVHTSDDPRDKPDESSLSNSRGKLHTVGEKVKSENNFEQRSDIAFCLKIDNCAIETSTLFKCIMANII